MSSFERRGALERRWESRPSRIQGFNYPPRLLARPRDPVGTSTWPPDSAHHRPHRKLIYLSFVRKAILWEKGVCHKSVHEHPVHRPSLCPRFLSHMKARPEDFQRSRFLNSKSKQQLPSQGNMHILTFPKTQILDGNFHPNPGRGQRGVVRGRCSAVVPGLQLPPTPPPSILSSTPPHHNTPQSDSVSQSKANSIPTSASSRPPLLLPLIVKDRPSERKNEQQPAVMELSSELNLRPAASTCSLTSLSQESNLSRPPSSLFSPSLSSPICSDLTSGRSSVLSNSSTAAAIVNSDPEGSVCVSSPQLSPVMQSPLSSYPPSESDLHRSLKNTSSPPDPPLQEEILSQPRLPSPCSLQDIGSHSDKPRSRGMRAEAAENLDISTDVSHKQSPSSSHGPATLASRSTTWSSSLSPQPTTTRSGSGTKCTPSPSPPVSPLESHRWSVLPPITPPRGHSSASRWSGLSCSQSQLFDDLEAIAPPSTSCLSLDQPSDSSGHPSPDTDLSPGLAALTVGCDSGNLGSLSRVQLLLLDRPVPETVLSPSASDQLFSPVHDWPDLMVQDEDPDLSSAGDLRPCTACSISERCDSAGNKSDWSDCGSGSPSSWIIDLSPTIDMFRSSDSTDRSNYGTPSHNGNPTGEEPNYPARGGQDLLPDGEGRPGSPERRDEEKEQWMEERKTKVLNMLSKLQDNTPVQSKSSQSRSNFEDFDFLAKYCIFSQEKLAEYKRAFEAEDSDGDGYISCLQVLLALKTIIPPELLSDQEEIYVYKILEMVDFRVTDGLVDLRLFAVIASLAEKIASMDEFMRTLISSMDFCSLEVRLFKAKQLFLFLLEEQPDDAGAQQGFISGEQLLLELKAGGIHLEQEAAIRLKLQDIPPFDLLDFLAHLPLFMLIHKSIIANPLDDYTHF